jgi:hypothetical protein
MAKNNLLQNGNAPDVVENPPPIKITKNTVRFGADIYQFRNISGFGLGEIPNKDIIPKTIIGALFIFGIILIISVAKLWGIFLVLLAFAGIGMNNQQPKRYGLELYVNSGDNKIFITRDLEGIKNIVSVLYDFMESDLEESYVINIDQRNASIGVAYAENSILKNR